MIHHIYILVYPLVIVTTPSDVLYVHFGIIDLCAAHTVSIPTAMYLQTILFTVAIGAVASFSPISIAKRNILNYHATGRSLSMQGDGLKIDMRGKTIFIGGVADSSGYGWAIAKAAAEAGARILLGTWPPVLPVFQMGIERGQFAEDSKLADGTILEIAKVSFHTAITIVK